MKRQYMSPVVEEIVYNGEEELLSTVSSDWGIGYGTVDEDGTMEPASRYLEFDMLTSD